MADFRGKSYKDVRLYVVDKPIFEIKKQGEPTGRYWMNISAANDKFENEKDFIDRPSLGYGRPYQDKNGETQYDHSMAYSKSQLDRIASAVGLDPENYDVQELRGKTFRGDLMQASSKSQKGLIVNTSKMLKADEPLDKAAHDANTARAAELRPERDAEIKAKVQEASEKAPAPEVQQEAESQGLEISDDDLPF